MPRPFVILASENDIRVNLFQTALKQQGLPRAILITYLDFIQSPESLANTLNQQPCVLRIDSPGRDVNAYAAILEQGIPALKAAQKPYETVYGIQQKIVDKGRIIAPPQFYQGYKSVLSQVQKLLAKNTNTRVMNHPEDIMFAFDKFESQQALQKLHIPIPKPLGAITSYQQIREEMQLQQIPRVFIKLKYGSAASGIIALETSNKRIQIKTTINSVKNKQGELALYNTRQIQKSNDEAYIHQLIDTLCKMEVQVERWIPKAQVNGYTVDLRILMIAGKAHHTVLRMSHSPITNLHLLNQRADATLLKEKMTSQAWEALIHSCETVAKRFSKSLYIALDIAVSINYKHHYILEVNAFGDLLKNTYHQNLSPQEAQIAHLKNNDQL